MLTSRGWKRSSCRLIGKRTHIVPVAVVLRIFEATENIEALESEHDALLLEACRNSEKLENMFLSVFMVCICLYNRNSVGTIAKAEETEEEACVFVFV